MVSDHRDQVRPRGMLPFDDMPKRFSRFYRCKRFKGVGAAHQVRSAAQFSSYLRKAMTKLYIKILVESDSAIESAFP